MDKVRINDTLKYFAQIIKENPSLDISDANGKKYIYPLLVKTNVPKEEQYTLISDIFAKWIDYYKDKENIKVFVDPNWSSFCQFTNNVGNGKTHIKIYVPTKANYIEENSKIIFDYLSKNNIHHQSKINTRIRFDNIVIRLNEVNDAINLLNFINSNKEIQEGLIEANPFSFTHNNIAIASDGYNSYNTTIACYIVMYLRNKRDNNDLDNVSSDDFANFIKDYYIDTFIKKNNLRSKDKDFKFISQTNFYEDILDVKHISELFLKAYKGMSIADYFEHYNRTRNINNRNKEISDLKNNNLENNKESNLLRANKNLLLIYKELLKYYERMDVFDILTDYFSTGNANYLTRRSNIRQMAVDSNIREILNPIIEEEHTTIYDYIKDLLISDLCKEKVNSDKEELSDWKLIEKYFVVAKDKYDKEHTIASFMSYIYSGNDKYITRDSNLRHDFVACNLREKIKFILRSYGFSPLDYTKFFDKYYDELIEKEDSKTL